MLADFEVPGQVFELITAFFVITVPAVVFDRAFVLGGGIVQSEIQNGVVNGFFDLEAGSYLEHVLDGHVAEYVQIPNLNLRS